MLKTYAEKRDFEITPEPRGREPNAGSAGAPRFVIQKHAAHRAGLHYDVRLEVQGVLVSWAVGKGPSFDPAQKRLAVHVEDHPLDYATFEGTIPKGEYGAGEVIVWDTGFYMPDEPAGIDPNDRKTIDEVMLKGLEAGKLSVTFEGQKLHGSWAFVRMKGRGDKNWLLLKHRDTFADSSRDILLEDRSVLSFVSVAEVRAGVDPGTKRHRPEADGQESGDGARRVPTPFISPESLPGARAVAFPHPSEFGKPMLPTLTDKAFSHPNWIFEPKLDGVRTLAFLRKSSVTLISRSGRDVTHQYPAVAAELGRGQEHDLILDGEIVALDANGRPSFERLQGRINLARAADIKRADQSIPVSYYVFDLLYADGYDLRRVVLEERKRLLASLAPVGRGVQLVESFAEEGQTAYEAFVSFGLEGVVAKRKDSVYESGKRVTTWLKVKGTTNEDFVVIGYTEGGGAREKTFGALILATYDQKGQLVFAGHAGTGFDDHTLRELKKRLDTLVTDECPLPEAPPSNASQRWVLPELVAEVKFSQWTNDGLLRAPVFVGLREDKSSEEATREVVVPVPGGNEEGPGPALDARRAKGRMRAHSAAEVAVKEDSLAYGDPTRAAADAILEQLRDAKEKLRVDVEGVRIELTNLSKTFWPATEQSPEVTKRDFIEHLMQVAPNVLSHLRDRPLTLVRCPDGLLGQRFYQRHIERGLPRFMQTVRLYAEHNVGDGDYLICNNLPTLLWLGQIAALELHPWYSRITPEPDGHHLGTQFAGSEENIESSLLNYPDFVVFDLDPYIYSGKEAKGEEPELNRDAYARTVEVAFWLKELLDGLGLPAFVKTSGRTGLHIFVPTFRKLDYTSARAACETIGRFVLQAHPKVVTMDWTVSKRAGKVFLDHNQNVRSKTLASIFSPRLGAGAPVSMPLEWNELEDIYPTDFTVLSAGAELARRGDSWAGILDAKVDLEARFHIPSVSAG